MDKRSQPPRPRHFAEITSEKHAEEAEQFGSLIKLVRRESLELFFRVEACVFEHSAKRSLPPAALGVKW
jgi:hypothetical protein